MITFNRKHNDVDAFWEVSVHLSNFLGDFSKLFSGSYGQLLGSNFVSSGVFLGYRLA